MPQTVFAYSQETQSEDKYHQNKRQYVDIFSSLHKQVDLENLLFFFFFFLAMPETCGIP